MNRTGLRAFVTVGMLLLTVVPSLARPFGEDGFQGRIALSHDGNFNDEDDWGAFPVVIAMLDAFGVKEKLVHVEYNNITQDNDDRFEREMTASVLGAAGQYGIPPEVLHNCRTDLDEAVASVRDAINTSSPEDPLYYLMAGPMDVPYRGILAADPARRRYVYCISHSSWNDGYGNRRIEGRTKRDLIALGVNWIQIGHGGLLAYSGRPGTQSTPAEWALFHWMRDSSDARLRWLFTRLQAEGRCDVSDATITYFLLTGDERCDPQKSAALLGREQKPTPLAIRPTIKLEAENFRLLDNCTPVSARRQTSQNWLDEMEAAELNVLFNFYNDFDDYEELAGWKLDDAGNLHPQEKCFIETLVSRFKHHKNIIWAIEESCNKLSRAKQERLKKVAEPVARTDNYHHPIAQMFQILYYDEVHADKVGPEDYVDDAHVHMMTWGHYATKDKKLPALEQYYEALVEHGQQAAGRYALLNTEVDKHPYAGAKSRLYSWTSAMANMYAANAYHRPDKNYVPRATFEDDGRIRMFMEGTGFHRMWPRPSGIGTEAALYVKRLDGVVLAESK